MQRDDSDFADFFGVADGGSFFGEIDEALKVKDPSVEYYPEPFCEMAESKRKEGTLLHAWSDPLISHFASLLEIQPSANISLCRLTHSMLREQHF